MRLAILSVLMAAAAATALAQPASLAGVKDEGTFLLYQNETRLATVDCKWQPDGSLEIKSTLSMAG